MRYRAFRTKKDNLYYFQFLTDDGTVVLRSDSFADKAACFDGIRKVMQVAGNADAYTLSGDGNGKFQFRVTDGEGNLLGRSVAYDSEAEVTEAMALLRVEGSTAVAKASESSGEGTSAGQSTPNPAPAKTSTSSSATTDDYRPLAFYESRVSGIERGFETFTGEEEHYFTYNMDGLVLMISEGYASEKSRDNGVNSVTKNMVIAERYQRAVHPNGKHYFNLRAGNNQEIATSRWFDDAGKMEEAIGWLLNGEAAKGALRSYFLGEGDRIYVDYRPLAFYAERISGTEFGYDAFENADDSYFTVNYEGAPVLISERYQSTAGRDKGIKSVKKNVKIENRYVREVHPNGKHYFRLLAGNKQEIATSRWFDSAKEMEKSISWLLSTGGTRRRKKPTRAKKEAAERTYVVQGQSYPCSEVTYDSFRSGGNQKYYFVYKTKEGKAILINGDVRGYTTEEDLAEAIKKVQKFAPKKDQYERRETKNGKHYFIIKDDEGKSVARSSLFYPDTDAMEAAIKVLACGALLTPAAPQGKEAVVDDYLPCQAYLAELGGFHSFQDETSKEYYFSFNSEGGTTLLRSEGYTTAAARDNGIQSVIKNAPNEARWGTATALNDKYHYYYLRAGNHQEIARSCYYDTEADMQSDYAWIRGENSTIGMGSALVGSSLMSAAMLRQKAAEEEAARAAATPDKVVDDYLPCEAYAGDPGFYSFFREDKKEYYFSYNRESDQKTLLRSEGYTTAAARDNGIQSVIKNAPNEARWGTATALNDKYHYYYLRAGNNQEIARSCYYEDAALMLADLDWVRGEESIIGVGSGLVEGALFSAAMLRQRAADEAAAAAALAAATPEKVVDDYMPCEAYAGESGFHSFFQEDKKEYYFSFNREDDQKTLLRSEGYTTAAARDNGIQSVIKNAPIEERWGSDTALEGKYHYYYLRAGNHQEIARSCYYEDAALMLADLNWIRGEESPIGMGSAMVGGALMSAAMLSSRKAEEAAAEAAAEAARLQAEEEARQAAALAAERKAEEEKAAAAAAAAKLQAEQEAQLKAEEEARLAAEAEAQRKAEAEKAAAAAAVAAAAAAKLQAEQEAQLKAEEEARLAAEAEAQRKAEAEKAAAAAAVAAAAAAKLKAEQEAQLKAEEAARLAAEAQRKAEAEKAAAAAAAAAKVANVRAESTRVEEKRGGLGWLWWVLPLLLLLLALFLLRDCDGCNKAVPAEPGTPTSEQAPPPPVEETPKEPFGPDGAALGFGVGTMAYNMANFLSDPDRSFPRNFGSDNILFSRNRARLSGTSKRELDDLVALLKEYPDINVDMYGYIDGTESGTYRGSKEVSLDDVRAREVFNYLKSAGLDAGRLNFEGAGTDDRRTVEFGLRKN